MKKFSELMGASVLILCAVLVLVFPQQTAQGIDEGIELCLKRIIPSIFPMMLVSVLVVESGYAQKLGKLLAPVSYGFFGLPGEAGTALLLSVIGGYPAGAKAVVGLFERGAVSAAQARRMSLFCFCAGPAFLIGVVGGLTGRPSYGWLLMGVQLFTVIIMSMIAGDKKKQPTGNRSAVSAEKQGSESLTDAFVASVSKSSDAMLQVCLYVVVFSAVRKLTEQIGLSSMLTSALSHIGIGSFTAQAIIPALLEVTGGCVSAVNAGLPMMAFAVGFGGLSVQMQVLAIYEQLGINKSLFLAARFFQGMLSALLTAGVLKMMPDSYIAASSSRFGNARLSGSPQGAVMLLVMCAMCVLCLPGKENTARLSRGIDSVSSRRYQMRHRRPMQEQQNFAFR